MKTIYLHMMYETDKPVVFYTDETLDFPEDLRLVVVPTNRSDNPMKHACEVCAEDYSLEPEAKFYVFTRDNPEGQHICVECVGPLPWVKDYEIQKRKSSI